MISLKAAWTSLSLRSFGDWYRTRNSTSATVPTSAGTRRRSVNVFSVQSKKDEEFVSLRSASIIDWTSEGGAQTREHFDLTASFVMASSSYSFRHGLQRFRCSKKPPP